MVCVQDTVRRSSTAHEYPSIETHMHSLYWTYVHFVYAIMVVVFCAGWGSLMMSLIVATY